MISPKGALVRGTIDSIDIHAHIVPEEALAALERENKKLAPRRVTTEPGKQFLVLHDGTHVPADPGMFDVELRLAHMDRIGMSVQALTVVPTLVYYDLEPAVSLAFAQILNESIASVARAWPERFFPLATVPLQDTQLAVQELERAVRDLAMVGVQIATNVNGRNLDHPDLWPFYEKLVELDLPIVVHPHAVAAADRLTEYYLINLLGNPIDTSIAIASLIFGGVLDAFPSLRFCFVHAGGFVPYQRGRLEHGFQVRAEPKRKVSLPPSEYLSLLYFDTLSHYVPALAYLLETVGPDRLMLGSDYPFDMGDPNPIQTVDRIPGLDPERRRQILSGTARSFLRLPDRPFSGLHLA
jgi:aminocarboxymuconate-semialdehyde decarboxylase